MTNKTISVIGVPMDLGQNRRGVDMGPSAMRYAGAVEKLKGLGYDVNDRGDIQTRKRTQFEDKGRQQLQHLHEIVHVNSQLAQQVSEVAANQQIPLVLGGDHSIAIGAIAGIAKHCENLGVIWFDAHGDVNTVETSPSGNIHGMPLAVSLGYGDPALLGIGDSQRKVKPENIVMIGVRSLDDGEKAFIRKHGIKVYTMHEIDRLGMTKVIEEAIDVVTRHTDAVHLSVDLDGLDPQDAPGVGTPVIGGMTYREGHLAMEILAEAEIVTSAEFVEVNPILDEKNKTAEAAVALMGSLFGENLK